MKKTAFLLFTAYLGLGLHTHAQSAQTAQTPTPPTYHVYAIRFSSMAHPTAISVWSDKGPDNDSVNIDFSIWLIKGDNGKNILLDAGFQNDLPEAKEFECKNYTRPDSALAKLNLKPQDITDIILSHPHWDHIDGVGLFPNAHI